MVFSTFIKLAKHTEKILFFQSAYPYLNSNSLAKYNNHYTKHWPNEDPHPTSNTGRYFLSIDTGHYGLYYTIFSHDAEKRKKSQLHQLQQHQQHLQQLQQHKQHNVIQEEYQLDSVPIDALNTFFISKLNREIHHNIRHLTTVSRTILSSFVKSSPSFAFGSQRFLSTSTLTHQRVKPQITQQATLKPQDALDRVEQQQPISEQPFEQYFAQTQISQIITAYNSHTTASDLNIIYPLYQALKRNDITCPSIDIYNIILTSINERSLDNDENTVEAIESRLTCLLTVYQDILQAANTNELLKPTHATFSIVLQGIFKGSLDCIKLTHFHNSPQVIYNDMFIKSQEFCQIGIDILMSIKNTDKLSLESILPQLITIINVHPNLITPELLQKVLYLKDQPINYSDGQYYVGLISLAKFLPSYIPNFTNDQAYEFIQEVYQNYRSQLESNHQFIDYQTQIYSTIIQSLMKTDNSGFALKFLDDILIDYKSSIDQAADIIDSKQPLSPSKAMVSDLISIFLESMLVPGDIQSSFKAYKFLMKFQSLGYIPELSVGLYNELINNLINNYNILEQEKVSVINDKHRLSVIKRTQANHDTMIWRLYNSVAIRRDFQDWQCHADLTSLFLNNKKVQCRDFLLSLSIDLGHHERVFQLIKEVILKNHLIFDINSLKKTCSYLYQGSIVNNNEEYFSLMWNLVELQSAHYQHNSKFLNHFVSEMSHWLVGGDSPRVDMLLDSVMVGNAFTGFKLDSDNIYGLMVIMKTLLNHCNTVRDLDVTLLFKISQYQAQLINELEDTENHYVELGDELSQLKSLVKQSFQQNITIGQTLPQFKLSSDMIDACHTLYLNVENNKVMDNFNSYYNLNLSHLLSIDYKTGMTKFIDLFRKGYNFNKDTWLILINQRFLMEFLQQNPVIRIEDFVDRIMKLNFSDEFINITLVTKLLEYNLDKVTIQTLKYMLNPANVERTTKLIKDNNIMRVLSRCMATSPNQYLSSIMIQNFEHFYKINSLHAWVGEFLQALVYQKRFDIVDSIFTSHELEFKDKLDMSCQADRLISHAISSSLLQSNKSEEFIQYFKMVLAAAAREQVEMLQSPELVESMLNYYIATGDFKLALDRILPVIGNNEQVDQLYRFAEFMYSITDTESKSYQPVVMQKTTLEELACRLVYDGFTSNMVEVFTENKFLINLNKEVFVNLCLDQFIKAAKLCDSLLWDTLPVYKAFQNFLKFLKVARITSLSLSNLHSIVNVLTSLKLNGLLQVLVNKFISFEHGMAPMVNFYFLELFIDSDLERVRLLAQFKAAFTQLNDSLNLKLIEDFANDQNIDLTT